ncbi:MAG: hypothetical protein KC442_06560 [Thermomicrobiales bacterium]|nr:hypothetical protein [Thermomicrobiales bacterium]
MTEPVMRPTRLSQPQRKTLLVLHMVCGIPWMGLDIALLVLAVTALRTADAAVAYSSYQAIAIAFPGPVLVLSCGMVLTGLLLGWGTHWGLLRSWWVLVKLVLALVMLALVFFSLAPTLTGISAQLTAGLSAEDLRSSLTPLPAMLLFPPVVSFLMLATAVILSVFKPWGLTPWTPDPKRSRQRGSRLVSAQQ